MTYGQAMQPEPNQPCQPYQKQDLNRWAEHIKYLMFSMNLYISFCASCGAIVQGISTLVKHSPIGDAFGTNLAEVASYLLIIAGASWFFTVGLVCYGVLRKNKRCIIMYFVILMVMFILCLTGMILGIIYPAQIDDHLHNKMMEMLRNDYGVNQDNKYNQAITYSWDRLQSKFECCSVDDMGWSTYRGSEWYKIQAGVPEHTKPFVPETCCKKDQYGNYIEKQKCQTWNQGPPGKQSGVPNEALFYEGCFEKGKQLIKDSSGIITRCGIAMGVSMLFGMFFSVFLLCRL